MKACAGSIPVLSAIFILIIKLHKSILESHEVVMHSKGTFMKNFGIFTIPVYLLLSIWAVFLIDIIIPIKINSFGIVPRDVNHLIGILSSPFLHANLFHLISNSVPLFVLSSVMVFFYRKISVWAIIHIAVLGGFMVWLFARNGNHIGASGVIYGLAGFIIAFGIFSKKVLPIIIAVIITFTYGFSMLSGMLPVRSYISWEGHLFGAIAGIIVAYALKNQDN